VLALAEEHESLEAAQALDEKLMAGFRLLVASRVLNHECGLCHSVELRVDIRATIYRTMEEARPGLRAEEERQAASAKLIKSSRN
jgi:hypothetical protein